MGEDLEGESQMPDGVPREQAEGFGGEGAGAAEEVVDVGG